MLVVVAACGSAQDLAGQATPDPDETSPTEETEPTSPPTDESEPTSPPTEETPSPTPTPQVAKPKQGDCRKMEIYNLITRVSRSSSEPVKCANKHNAQTYAVKSLAGKLKKAVESGNDKKVYNAARNFCDNKLGKWLKANEKRRAYSQFGFIVGVPSSSDATSGANWVRCDVFLRNGSTKMAKLPRSTKGALKNPKGKDYHTCVKGSDLSSMSNSVPCYRKHQWRGVSSIRLAKPSKNKYPGKGKLQNIVKKRCGDDVRDYLNTSSSFRYGYITPSKQSWKRGERFGVCLAKTTD